MRNSIIYDDGAIRFSKSFIFKCASDLAKCVPRNCAHDLRSRRVCALFHISPPLLQSFKVTWIPWRPTVCGNTCNIAIHVDNTGSKVAALIRERWGIFSYALKATSSLNQFPKVEVSII